MDQLQAAFKNDKVWIDALKSPASALKICLEGYFQSEFKCKETNQIQYRLPGLLLLGILCCIGTKEKKSKALYHLFQDNIQKTISAQDRDLLIVFSQIIKFSTVMMYQYQMAKLKLKQKAQPEERDIYGEKLDKTTTQGFSHKKMSQADLKEKVDGITDEFIQEMCEEHFIKPIFEVKS